MPAGLKPEETMKQFNFHDKIQKGKVFIRIMKGKHVLKEVGTLANQQVQ